eukprot:6010239-Pyramimonas_sp.AAC.1
MRMLVRERGTRGRDLTNLPGATVRDGCPNSILLARPALGTSASLIAALALPRHRAIRRRQP